ncbi:hypothetical protein Unana1_06275 [Umbelopsis nana]
MAGDGNCLFRALSDQYYGTDKHHAEIRHKICQFLRENEGSYQMFVEDDQTFSWHVDNMENLGVFGGNMELAAFAKLEKVDIKIYQPGFISVRNIDGPSQGPPEIKDRPIEQSVSSEPTAKEKEVLNACPNASLSQVRKMLITHDQDIDEAIEAIYEAEYQTSDPPPNDSIAQPKLDEAPIQESEAAASPPGRTFSSGLENANDADGLSQESGADDNKKRKRMTARDRQMQAKMKQKQQRKAKKKAVDDEQQEAKPLPTVNKDEDHDTLQDSRYSQDDGEESALIYKSKHDYAELEVDDSSAHEEAPLSQVPSDPTLDAALRLPTDGGSIFESFVNMANSIVGAGIIGLPFAFKEAGLWMGIVLLIGLTIVVDWTVRLLIFNGKMAGQTTYIDLMDFAFGRPGRIAISIFSFIFAFGAMCAYCVIIGDTIPHVIRSLVPTIDSIPILWMFSNRRLCITFFTVTVSWPLSMYRDISKLAKTSALALSAIFVIIITVLIEGPKMAAEIRGAPIDPLDLINNEVFQAIGVISFGCTEIEQEGKAH